MSDFTKFSCGIDRLLRQPELRRPLSGKRVAVVAHPASVTRELEHSVDALVEQGFNVTALFGPQHGIRGDKQDNMVESDDELDPVHQIPAFSLYGEVRRPTREMLDCFDVLLVDLQDVGCRIYTFLTTLFYLLEDCAAAGKSLWVLDRPNPAGRPIDGLSLLAGNESFVGAASIPMRHGLTLGEAARWYCRHNNIDVDLNVIAMDGYVIDSAPGYGWPVTRPWINPSPNLATLNSARTYSGTVILEGTTLSEGRGSTRPLEYVGAPDLPVQEVLATMQNLSIEWMRGCRLRPCFFEPTFQKHVGQRCAGFQIHADHEAYGHLVFKPYRLIALFLKSLRLVRPDYDIWREFPYEYVIGRMPIDVINGGPYLRQWVDDPGSTVLEMQEPLDRDEIEWKESSSLFHLY